MILKFKKSFIRQLPLAATGSIKKLLAEANLHRYSKTKNQPTALLEKKFANWQGRKYCVAVSSGGAALYLSLLAAGVKRGDKILANAYTLAPVAGAIYQTGAKPIFVEINKNWHIDIADLEKKAKSAKSTTGAKFLLLSHMRGHIANMNKIVNLCNKYKLVLIEDCAHTMGAKWGIKLRKKRSGNFGEVAAFSTQTYKHINSGEGGLLVTDNPKIAAKAILYSGSYMFFENHGAHGTVPPKHFFKKLQPTIPNYSLRLDNLRSLLILQQLPELQKNCARWNELYNTLAGELAKCKNIIIPKRVVAEKFVGSSLQFRTSNLTGEKQFQKFIKNCKLRGVELKWFGAEKPQGYTSRYDSWHFFKQQKLPNTLAILATTFDLRLPLTFTKTDCKLIGKIICEEVAKVL